MAGRSTRRRSRGSSRRCCRPPIASRRRHGPPTEFELLTAVVFRWFARRAGSTSRWSRWAWAVGWTRRTPGTAAWRRHERGPRPHGPARDDDPGDRPREGGDHRARRPRRHRGDGEALRRRPCAGARRSACRWSVGGAGAVRGGPGRAAVELPGLGLTRVGLRGRHQAANVAVAGRAARCARGRPGSPTAATAARRRGLRDGAWPGRLELVDVRRAGTCCWTARTTRPAPRPWHRRSTTSERRSVGRPMRRSRSVGSMADKDVPRIVDRGRGCREPSAARRSWPRSSTCRGRCPPTSWRRCGGSAPTWWPWSSPTSGVRWTGRCPPVVGPVVVAGSLYLVGAARARLVDDPALDDPAA